MNNFGHKYVVIATTTKNILLHPFSFGSTIGDTVEDTKRAALYLGEGVVFFYALYTTFLAGGGADLPLSNVPFAGEILAAVLIASTAVTALITHVVASRLSERKVSVHASLASFLYWAGFCLFVIPPVFAVMILGAQWLFDAISLGEDLRLLIMMAVMVPFAFVYYIGSISSWIGSAYDIEPVIGGLAVASSYALLVGGATLLTAVTSFATNTTL